MQATTLYFHGLPGSAAELSGFGPEIAARAVHFHVVARGDALAVGDPSGYFRRLAEQILRQFPGGPLHLVGFSAGAAAALRVAPLLGGRVQQIDLVSPAAPLNLGNFLGDMAGAPVFRAALAGRAPFAMLTWLQAQVARLVPARLAATLIAGALGADRALAADPRFIASLGQSLRTSLLGSRAAYTAEIRAYVTDWRDDLARVDQPVSIWQGSEDNWTPPAMAQALAAALPSRPRLTMLDGLSHFSTLRHFLAAEAAA